MSELLTTGQMIDRLKPGEVAESKNRKVYYDYNCQLIEESKATGEKRPFTIWSGDKSPIWRILPRYVSFEEAMKAYAEGKNIVFYPASNEECNPVRLPQCYRNYVLEDLRLGEFSLLELVNGKWTIEE